MDGNEKKHLLQENNPAALHKSTYEDAGFVSKTIFFWLYKTIVQAYRGKYSVKDLPPTATFLSATYNVDSFLRSMEGKSLFIKKENVVLNVFLSHRKWILVSLLGMLVGTQCQMYLMILLSRLAGVKDEAETTDLNSWFMFAQATVLQCVLCLTNTHCRLRLRIVEMSIKTTLISLIYKKILSVDGKLLGSKSSGHIITLIATDIERINVALSDLATLTSGFALLIVGMIYNSDHFNVAVLPGLLLICVYLLFQICLAYICGILSLKQKEQTDKRVDLMHEIVRSIRVVKMYCWEKPFTLKAEELRRQEMQTQLLRSILSSIIICCNFVVYKCTVFIVVFTSVSLGGGLVSEKNAILVGTLKLTTFYFLYGTAYTLLFISDMISSGKRINELLNMNEEHLMFTRSPKPCVYINKLSASWKTLTNKTDDFTLDGININVENAHLLGITGRVGSGKSSLLKMLLGEMHIHSGSHHIRGTVAYVPQEAWIMSKTVRDNIIMSNSFDLLHYQEVLRVCCLEEDLLRMPHGDQTLIGERGLTLSGGQKARIGLARAVYQNTDVYLLDDPLAAVDKKVAHKLFSGCIKGILKDKLCLLVTHQVHLLPHVDQVLLMHQGMVVKRGHYSDVSMHLSDYVDQADQELKMEITMDSLLPDEESDSTLHISEAVNRVEQTDTEEAAMVSYAVYLNYLRAGKAWLLVPVFLILAGLGMASALGFDWILVTWTSSSKNLAHNGTQFQGFNISNVSLSNRETGVSGTNNLKFLGILLSLVALFMPLAFITLMVITTVASKHLYNSMFARVLKAPTSFFDKHPVGQVLNRFSRDTTFMDYTLILLLVPALISLLYVIMIDQIYVCITNPYSLISLAFALAIFSLIFIVTLPSVKISKKLESGLRSATFSHITSTLDGLSVIRPMCRKADFMAEAHAHMDIHSSAWFLSVTTNAFLRFYGMVISSTAMSVIILILIHTGGSSTDSVRLALIYLVTILDHLQFFFRQVAEIEICMTSVERIQQYSRLEQEAPDHSHITPPPDWPPQGNIQFKHMELTYKEQPTPALGPIDINIRAREKIGIVGRTGAGKSSIMVSLLRMEEPEGTIIIDGFITRHLGLADLRSSLSVIPQDPVLFQGSLRYNLDPISEFTDAHISSMLEKVELLHKVQSLSHGLDTDMGEKGSNLSVGEKQLICLARAMLKKSRIVLIDEATANVDNQTDSVIQKTLGQYLSGSTVLTIAHRLHTVLNADRIMVLDQGKVVQFGPPFDLILEEGGLFYSMLNVHGRERFNAYKALLSKMKEEKVQQKTEKNDRLTLLCKRLVIGALIFQKITEDLENLHDDT